MAAGSREGPPYTVLDPDDREAHPYYVSPLLVRHRGCSVRMQLQQCFKMPCLDGPAVLTSHGRLCSLDPHRDVAHHLPWYSYADASLIRHY